MTHLSNHAAKLWYECPDILIVIWGAELRDLLSTPPINHAFSNRNSSISNEIAIGMSDEHRNESHFFSPLWNAKPEPRRSLLSSVDSR